MKGSFPLLGFVALQSTSMLARSMLVAESRGNSARAIEAVADRGGGGTNGGEEAMHRVATYTQSCHQPCTRPRRTCRGGSGSGPIGARPSVQLRLGCVPPCRSEQRLVQLEERERCTPTLTVQPRQAPPPPRHRNAIQAPLRFALCSLTAVTALFVPRLFLRLPSTLCMSERPG